VDETAPPSATRSLSPTDAGEDMKQELYQFFQPNSPLLQYRSDVTSQCGEDGIIDRINQLLRPGTPFCVEFGAWDGKLHSNCHNLLKNKGWSGLMIEANKDKYQDLVKTYSGDNNVTTVNRFVSFDGDNTLDKILAGHGAPEKFGLLSIDVDGNDYYIWESLANYSPEIVVIEFNPTIPNDVLFVQDKSFEVNQGCSLLALVMLGKQKGYELAVCTAWNALFVRNDKFGLLGIQDNFIANLYTPLQNGRIFQGYDGSIHVVGMDQLMWKGGMRVSSEDFQVLPKAFRVWGDAQKS
jgi:hypothetical protein